MTGRDIVLVTVDSWRADAVEHMPWVRGRAERGEFSRSTAVSQSAATHGAFSSILASQFLLQAYDPDGSVRPTTTPLPAVLDRAGYATCGIIASNPFLARWEPYFDHFWNDGMTAEKASHKQQWYSTVDRVKRFLTLQTRVSATEVADRARQWYRRQDSPRFLWMHLMDVHTPYFPGIRRGLDAGGVGAYSTLYDFHVRDNNSPENVANLRPLYEQCVERLDEQFASLLEFVDDDATVVVTGDHGEAFDHDVHGHAQLYDEVVTTPLFTENLSHPVEESTVRHLDLAPTLLDEHGIDRPQPWEGRPIDGQPRTSLLFNHSPRTGHTYAGVRTAEHKFIKTYDDTEWTVENRELYDLTTDPTEQRPLDDSTVAEELEAVVDDFLSRDDVKVDTIRETSSGIDGQVEDRLKELGYM